MKKGDYLTTILRSDKTVFTSKDIALLWQDNNTDSTKAKLSYYVKHGDLYRIRRGLYAKNKNYNQLELATRIFTPSYVSFETVLAKEGLIFQYYTHITAASYLTREVTIDDRVFSYRKIKAEMLTNSEGIEHKDETSIATKERAFLDTLYSKVDYHFDNIRSLNWEIVFKLLPLYQNKRMANKVQELYQ